MTADLTPDMMDPCPYVPEGATEWEAQEIRRHWRNALSSLDDVRRGVAYEGDRLWLRGRYAVPAHAVEYDHRVGGGGVAYDAMQAEAAMLALARVRDGALHRMAVARQEAEHKAAVEGDWSEPL